MPASSWLKKFWYVPALPDGPVCTSTWMSGLASFQIATASSMPGIQDVNVRVTSPSDGSQAAASLPLPLSPPAEHAAIVRATVAITATPAARFM